jgi:ribosomal protein S18 acetylase RimI-like enzyme
MMPVRDLDGADPRSTVAAARLLASSVPDEAAGLVPYTLADYHRYLSVLLDQPPALRSVLVRALFEEGTPVAVADWRVLAGTLFLNGLSVVHALRGRGLGSRLLEDGIVLAQELGLVHLALDVATHNVAALALYRRNGFTVTAESSWYQVPAGEDDKAGVAARILDWPVFCALRAAYGFADLSLRNHRGVVSVVRVVGDALRLDPLAHDLGLSVADLCKVTGCRRAYAVGGAPVSPFVSFVRMARLANGSTTV